MTEPTDQEPEGQTRPFAAALQELNRGRVHDELSRELQRLVEAVVDTGRKGTLTLQLTINPTGDTGAMSINDQISVKAPRHDRAASLFFVTDDANLVRHDPRQMELPLREVAGIDRRTGELKEATQ